MFTLPLKQTNRWAVALSLCIVVSGLGVSAAMPDEPRWVALVDDMVSTSPENEAVLSSESDSSISGKDAVWKTTVITADKAIEKARLLAVVDGRICSFSKRVEKSTCACVGNEFPFEYKVETLQASPVGQQNRDTAINESVFPVFGSRTLAAARKEQRQHLNVCSKPESESSSDSSSNSNSVQLATYQTYRVDCDPIEGDTYHMLKKKAGPPTILEDRVNILSIYGDKFGVETATYEQNSEHVQPKYVRQWQTVGFSSSGSHDVRLGTWWHKASLAVEDKFFNSSLDERQELNPDGWRSFVITPGAGIANVEFGLNHNKEMKVLETTISEGLNPYLYFKPSIERVLNNNGGANLLEQDLTLPTDLLPSATARSTSETTKPKVSFSSTSPDGRTVVFVMNKQLFVRRNPMGFGSGSTEYIGAAENVRGIQWLPQSKINRADAKALQL